MIQKKELLIYYCRVLQYKLITFNNLLIDIYFEKLKCSIWMIDCLLLYNEFVTFKEEIPKEVKIKYKLILNVIKVQNPKYNNNII